jgi:ABC-2 type transport system ATP-binding protein
MGHSSAGGQAIVAERLVKHYGREVPALDGLSFSVPPGTTFGLLGPNGAGKTTTVKVLSTLTTLDDGRARVAGIDVQRDPAAVRRTIGVVGQRAAIDPEATGRENLCLHGHLFGLAGGELRRRVDGLLGQFGLTDAAERLARTYSGGMQRKLHVAMGLINEPRVVFLDEPTTGLDPEARAELWTEIRRLARQRGITILLTTHYLEEADRLADRLAIIDHGRVVAEGTPDGLKADLRGDAISVELTETSLGEQASAALAAVGGLGQPVIEGRVLRARAERGATAAPAVLASLEAAGIGVASVTISRPSLDDVYLHHTGRSYRESEEAYA